MGATEKRSQIGKALPDQSVTALNPYFGTRGSEVQILSPRPFFSRPFNCLRSLVFVLEIWGQTGRTPLLRDLANQKTGERPVCPQVFQGQGGAQVSRPATWATRSSNSNFLHHEEPNASVLRRQWQSFSSRFGTKIEARVDHKTEKVDRAEKLGLVIERKNV